MTIETSNLSLPKNDIEQMLGMFSIGRYAELEILSKDRLGEFPNSGFLWKILGASLQVQGKESLAALQKAVELSPGDSNAHSTLGNTWQNLGEYEKAAASHQQALALNPVDAGAYCNLGNALKALGQHDQALNAYMQALGINPNLAQAHQNLGAIFLDAGMYKDAALAASNAIKINPNYAEAYDCLAIASVETGQVREALNSLDRALCINPAFANAHYHRAFTALYAGDHATAIAEFIWVITNGPDNLKLEASVYGAVLRYTAGDLQSCNHLLNLSASILNLESEHKNACVYWRYLTLLLSEFPGIPAPSLPTLHVIGDSHSLSAAHTILNYEGKQLRSQTEWIIGCKAWHLGNEHANRYKFQFEDAMARLPKGSTVLLMFGEIDCRVDEGILNTWRKNRDQDISALVSNTVTRYFEYVSSVGGKHGHSLIFAGVPCPAIDLATIPQEEADKLILTIRKYNQQLKHRCLVRDSTFLDFHGMTDAGNGMSNGKWHLDLYHLTPGMFTSIKI